MLSVCRRGRERLIIATAVKKDWPANAPDVAMLAVTDVEEAVEETDVLVREHFVDRIDRCVRHVAVVKSIDPVLARLGLCDEADHLGKLAEARYALFSCLKLRIVD